MFHLDIDLFNRLNKGRDLARKGTEIIASVCSYRCADPQSQTRCASLRTNSQTERSTIQLRQKRRI